MNGRDEKKRQEIMKERQWGKRERERKKKNERTNVI